MSPLDTVKIKAYHELFLYYEFEDPEKSKGFLDHAMALAGKNQQDAIWIGRTNIFYGYFFEDKGDLYPAMKRYQEALEVYTKIGYQNGIAAAENDLGNVTRMMGNYSESLKHNFAAMRVREKMGDTKGLVDSYNNIGVAFYYQGNLDEALKNYLACLELSKQMNDRRRMAVVYDNIGGVYTDLGRYEDAIKSHLASLSLDEQIGSKKGMVSCYNNLGNVFSEKARHEQNPKKQMESYHEALRYLFLSAKMKEEGANESTLSTTWYNIGAVYRNLGQPGPSRKYLLLARGAARGDKEVLKMVWQELSRLDSAAGNFRAAFEDEKLYTIYRDSIDNEETRKRTIQEQMSYEFGKKEAVGEAEHKKELAKQQALAEEKNRKQNLIIGFVAGGLILMIAFAIFVFRSLRITRKQKAVIGEQKSEVEAQKLRAEYQKGLVEEKQKEIIDSINYAGRIQRSQMPTEKHIHSILTRMRIKEK